jgi:hypothetical protein
MAVAPSTIDDGLEVVRVAVQKIWTLVDKPGSNFTGKLFGLCVFVSLMSEDSPHQAYRRERTSPFWPIREWWLYDMMSSTSKPVLMSLAIAGCSPRPGRADFQ